MRFPSGVLLNQESRCEWSVKQALGDPSGCVGPGLSVEYRNIFQVTQLDREITVYSSEANALLAAHDLLDSRDAAPPPTPASKTFCLLKTSAELLSAIQAKAATSGHRIVVQIESLRCY